MRAIATYLGLPAARPIAPMAVQAPAYRRLLLAIRVVLLLPDAGGRRGSLLAMSTVDFWFDPGCPFTWRASRWLTDVGERRPLLITWRLMSLAILNEDKDVPPEWRSRLEQLAAVGWLLEAVRVEHGNETLAATYTSIGSRLHESNQEPDDGTLRAALTDVGLSGHLLEASRAESIRQAVAASHAAGQAAAGQESGSPIISIEHGPGYFGPIVVPIPTGEEADRLFDAVALISAVPAFSELKRARRRS
jgi:hypothetical protein